LPQAPPVGASPSASTSSGGGAWQTIGKWAKAMRGVIKGIAPYVSPGVSTAIEATDNAMAVYKNMREGNRSVAMSVYAGAGAALARECGVENISYAIDGTDPVTGEQYSTLYRFFLYKYGEFQLVTTAFGIYGAMETAVGKLGGAMSKAPTQMEAALPKVQGGGCFLAGTPVCIYRSENSDQKEWVTIENVQPGEQIWSCDPRTGKWTPKTVLQALMREYSGDVIRFLYDSGFIEATGNHPVWIVDGDGLETRPKCRCLNGLDNDLRNGGRWVEARDLRVGDLLRGRLGETVRILNVESRFEETIVYNFDIDDFHTYAVGSREVLVHNSSMEPIINAGNLKNISADQLKKAGIDPHKFKDDFVGREVRSQFDIKIDSTTNELVLVPRKPGTKIPPQRTGVFLER